MAELPDPTPMGPEDRASIGEWGSVGYDLAHETEAYQAYAEGYRAACDAYDGSSESAALVDLMHEDLLKAKAALDLAWLGHTTGL
jgi:hypothetical protein